MDINTKTNIRITGKVATRVYYYKNKELVSRAYFIPVQPGTGAQLSWWNVFKAGVAAWQVLTQGEKDELDQRARRHKFSGFNLFMREWLTL
ncbi:hypothetical protein LCGC14_1240550 [marine sediment metagenome]|uniref:Uncharacterized protein n=1 Tax=marine sediment metagenome TaxID=412755 RepID=A0A0F9LT49_9ZZZZ|nr:hypothetical protein [Candidatus Aminicenantes bacterium]